MKFQTIFTSIILVLSGLSLTAQSDHSLLFKISGNGLEKPSYLYGTFHLLGDQFVAQKPRVQKAFEGADQIVVETEIDSALLLKFSMKAMMPGKSLKSMLDTTAYQTLQLFLMENMGTDVIMMDQFKPMFISTLITSVQAQKEVPLIEKYGGLPMDIYFLNEGRKQNKKVYTLEEMMEQASLLFDSVSLEDQTQTLNQMLSQLDENGKMLKEMSQLYFDENLNGLWKLSQQYEDEYGSISFLLDDRNKNWMRQLPEILNNGNAFIAVGALHLTGKVGLIQLLQEKGYTVEPVLKKD